MSVCHVILSPAWSLLLCSLSSHHYCVEYKKSHGSQWCQRHSSDSTGAAREKQWKSPQLDGYVRLVSGEHGKCTCREMLEEMPSTSSGRKGLVEVLWLCVGQTLLAEMSDPYLPEGLQKKKSPRLSHLQGPKNMEMIAWFRNFSGQGFSGTHPYRTDSGSSPISNQAFPHHSCFMAEGWGNMLLS